MPSSSNNKSKSKNNTKKNGNGGASIFNSLSSNRLEIIVAALLLTGKLRVDSVQLFRQATLIVGLTGKYKTLANQTNIDKIIKFLNDNGNITLDEMIEALKQKMEQ